MIRVSCFTKNCKDCTEGTCVGSDKKGNKLYCCPSHADERHREIAARECKHFRCSNPNKGILCENCGKGIGGK